MVLNDIYDPLLVKHFFEHRPENKIKTLGRLLLE